MDYSKYLYEPVYIITADGHELHGRLVEIHSSETSSGCEYLVLRKCGQLIEVPVEDISQFDVYGEYDPPLPERNLYPSSEEKEVYRRLLIKYREKAISQGRSTNFLDEALSELQ